MSAEQKSLAIMFADVRGSTRIYEKYGDVRGREMTAWSVNTFCRLTVEHGGTVIKTMGDGAMVTCPNAESALLAAIATQEAHIGHEAAIGIGVHYGPVIEEGDDVFGDAVNVSARLCGLAKAGEILTTEETTRTFPGLLRTMCRHIDTTMVKGRKEPVSIHQVTWESGGDSTMTIVAGSLSLSPGGKREKTLLLTVGGRDVTFSAKSESLTFGRMNCDVVVPDTLASRQHAKIEDWRGKFMLVDQSTNGTYVIFDHGGETKLKRDDTELTESGYIGLGRAPTPENEHRIRFVVNPGDE